MFSILSLWFTLFWVLTNGDLLGQISDQENGFTLDHTYVSDLDTLPTYALKYSDKTGLIFLGPSFIQPDAFTVMAHGNAAFNCLTRINTTSTFTPDLKLHHFTTDSSCSESTQRSIDYRRHGFGGHGKLNVELSDLPNPRCEGNYLSIVSTMIFPNPPGVPVLICLNGSINIAWNRHRLTPGHACREFHWRRILIPCPMIHSRQLLSLSCELEVLDGSHHGDKQLSVAVHKPGDVRLISNRYIKTEICESTCTFPLGNIKELSVTCPDGSEYHFNFETQLENDCVQTKVQGLRHINIFFCKLSYHPWLAMTFVIWVFVGIHVLRLSILVGIYFLDLVNRIILRCSSSTSAGGFSCSDCKGIILEPSDLSNHEGCVKGVCAYCLRQIGLNYMEEHLTRCNIYQNYLNGAPTAKDTTGSLVSRICDKVRKTIYTAFMIKGINYGIIFILFIFIFLPPIGAVEFQPPTNMITDYLKRLKLSRVATETEQPNLSYIELLKDELELCGLGCLHHPYTCMCPTDEYNSSVISAVSNTFVRYTNLIGGTNERTSEGHISLEEKERRTFLASLKSERDKHLENIVNTKLMSQVQFQHMRTFMTGTASADKLLTLPHLSKILTSWGIVNIETQLSPAANDLNIAYSWETTKMERNKIHTKGTASGKLKLSDKSGITWKISNPDSDEIKTVSLHIASSAQVYKIKLKYFTASRQISTWYKGACVGECPSHCSCSTSTCFQKTWEYDRGWGCNPTWCLNFNGGCSCCAMDVVGGPRKYILGIYEAEYSHTEIIICFNEGHDIGTCRVIKDNEHFGSGNFKVTASKAYSVDKKADSILGLMWVNTDENKIQTAHPSYMFSDPSVCDKSCNHGEIGDYKAWDIFTASGVESHKSVRELNNRVVLDELDEFATLHNIEMNHRRVNNTMSVNFKIVPKVTNKPKATDTNLPIEKLLDTTTTTGSSKESSSQIDSNSTTTEFDPEVKPNGRQHKRESLSGEKLVRKRRWVSSSDGAAVDDAIMRGIMSRENFVLMFFLDFLGNYNFIVHTGNNDVLGVITSGNLTSREQRYEYQFACDSWRQLQSSPSTRSPYYMMKVDFGTFHCTDVVSSPFDISVFIKSSVRRQRFIRSRTNHMRTHSVNQPTTKPEFPLNLNASTTIVSTSTVKATQPTTTLSTTPRTPPTVKSTTSTSTTAAPKPLQVESEAESSYGSKFRWGNIDDDNDPMMRDKINKPIIPTMLPNGDEDYDINEYLGLQPRVVNSDLVTKSEFDNFREDVEKRQDELEDKLDAVKNLALKMVEVFNEARTRVARDTTDKVDIENNYAETMSLLYAINKVRLDSPGPEVNLEKFLSEYNELFTVLDSFKEKYPEFVDSNIRRAVITGQLYLLTGGGSQQSMFSLGEFETIDLKLHLLTGNSTVEEGRETNKQHRRTARETCSNKRTLSQALDWLMDWYTTGIVNSFMKTNISELVSTINANSYMDVNMEVSKAVSDNNPVKREKREIESEVVITQLHDRLEEMSWNGITTEHTCHVGSWPDCNFIDLKVNLDREFQDLNKTSKHILDDFVVKRLWLGTGSKAGILAVHPRQGYGMIDFTIQANNFVFNRKETVAVVEKFKLKECTGCYGCNTGFICDFEVVLKSPDLVTFHFSAYSPLVILDRGGYNIRRLSEPQIIGIKGSSMVKEHNFTLCIEESIKRTLGLKKDICEQVGLALKEPVHRMIKRETVINSHSISSVSEVCSGWSFFSCVYSNIKNVGSTIYSWLAFGFGFTKTLLIIFFVLMGIAILACLFKKFIYCYRLRRTSRFLSVVERRAVSEKLRNRHHETEPKGFFGRFKIMFKGEPTLEECLPMIEKAA